MNAVFLAQDAMHGLTERFLNCYSLNHYSKLAYPLLDKQVLGIDEALLPPETLSLRRTMPEKPNGRQAAELLAQFYREFYPTAIRPLKRVTVTTQAWEKWRKKADGTNRHQGTETKRQTSPALQQSGAGNRAEKHTASAAIKAVEKIRSALRKKAYLFEGAYLHGSLSTLDFTGYSDVDLFAVIRKEAAADAQKILEARGVLAEVNKIVRSFDPLQHHGVFAATGQELDAYCSAWLPPEALKYATCIVGKRALSLKTRDSAQENKAALEEHLAYLKRQLHRKHRNIYDWKEFCSVVQLIPALLLAAKGKSAYKKHSFAKAKRLLRKESWKAVEIATKRREKFSYSLPLGSAFLKAPTFWPATIAAKMRLVAKDSELEAAVEKMLEDPVFK